MTANKPADALQVMKRLAKLYPDAKIALNFSNPLELLVATILSAQSTDVGVNKVTPALFKRYKTAADYANADVVEMESLIRSTGFYHAKTKSIMGAAKVLVRDFGGKVPKTMTKIITLPGVARKTGNVVLYNAYGVTEGIAVDTHVIRLSNRLGLSNEKDPVKIEAGLMKQVPKAKWGEFAYLMIDHGRAVCTARNPDHAGCVLNDICPSAFRI
jgi:endonuclease III